MTDRSRKPGSTVRGRLRPMVSLLERRELLAAAPSDYTQYMLALINRARANPAAEAQRLLQLSQSDPVLIRATQGWDLNAFAARLSSKGPLPPLAFNTRLIEAAQLQNATMLATNSQNHSPAGYLTNAAIAKASDGKAFYNVARAKWATGENLFAYSSNVDAYAPINYVDYFHAAFLIDWGNPDFGHLENLMAPGPSKAKRTSAPFSEIGIDLATDVIPTVPPPANPSNPANAGLNVGPAMVTQEFGWRSTGKPILTGAVFNDRNQNAFYDVSEGLGGVTIRAVLRNSRKAFTTTTWATGGFSLPLAAGRYTVTASGGALTGSWSSVVRIAKDNVAWNLPVQIVQQANLGSGGSVGTRSLSVNAPPATTPVAAGKVEIGSFSIDAAPASIDHAGQTARTLLDDLASNRGRRSIQFIRSQHRPRSPQSLFENRNPQ